MSRKDELQRELRQIEAEEARDRQEKLQRTKPRYSFQIAPVNAPGSWERIRDDSIKTYRITGRVINRAECLAAGWSERDLEGGGMNYLFNTLSGRIVTSTGGGNLYIHDSRFGGPNIEERDEDAERVYGELEAFLRDHPEGGCVTSIITSQRHSIYSR